MPPYGRGYKNSLNVTATPTANSAFLVLVKLSFDKAQHEAGLADGRFTEKHQFELADVCLCVGSTICTMLLTGWNTCSHLVHRDSTESQHDRQKTVSSFPIYTDSLLKVAR